MFKKEKKVRKKPTTFWGKLWYFIWYDDSILSWIVNIILAFLIIKFLIYPGLGLVFGTDLPIVAVVSESMEHDGSFEEWWLSPAKCGSGSCTQQEWYKDYNITKEDFKEFSFKNGFNKGDIIFLFRANPLKLDNGDVIVYASGKTYPIIHRVVDKWEEEGTTYFETKGDHNQGQIQDVALDEKKVSEQQLLGRASFRIPLLGYIKIGFVELLELIGVIK